MQIDEKGACAGFGYVRDAGQQMVQTRLEAISSINTRQVDELHGLACRLKETLARLRGEHPETKEEAMPKACGLIAQIECTLQKKDDIISTLNEIEREIRSLL